MQSPICLDTFICIYSPVNWCKKHVDRSLGYKSTKIGTNDCFTMYRVYG